MKPDIHPKWYPEAKVICACGNVIITGATKPEIRTDVCSQCHPFFTGEQRIVDTAGQVERFMRRLEKGEAARTRLEQERAAARRRREGRKKIKVIIEGEEEAETLTVAEEAE